MSALIPLYGFMQGDTLGLLILADPGETLSSLARKLADSASVRVAPRQGAAAELAVRLGDRLLDGRATVQSVGLEPLARFDVVFAATPIGVVGS